MLKSLENTKKTSEYHGKIKKFQKVEEKVVTIAKSKKFGTFYIVEFEITYRSKYKI